MTVPSHNLYDFVYQVTEKRFWMLYFYPWGNKDLINAKWYHSDEESLQDPINSLQYIQAEKFYPKQELNSMLIRNFQPILFCHDQEPLNFDLYSDGSPFYQELLNTVEKQNGFAIPNRNLRLSVLNSWQQQWILLHSELNSSELARYESTGQYVGAYWWSHAMLSRDWYRYAEHDPALKTRNIQKDFLIYARDTAGSRSYRRDFLDQIAPIADHCQVGSIRSATVTSDSSSTYDPFDFTSTNMSIVLETIFDHRIHLTEKILRPLACAHPFMLAAGPGSVKLLQNYGFKTFAPWINESYDLEQDHNQRLAMITAEMTRISILPTAEKQALFETCQRIADYNQQVFFSNEFIEKIKDELIDNVNMAYQCTGNKLNSEFYLWHRWQKKKHTPERVFNAVVDHQQYNIPLARHLRRNQGSFKQYQGHEHCLDDKSSANGDNV
jgi:hypothetical protein